MGSTCGPVSVSIQRAPCSQPSSGATRAGGTQGASPGLRMPVPDEFRFGFNLHWNIEGQLGHTDSAATVGTFVRPVEFKDEVREPIDDIWLLVETRRRIDHAEYSRPGRDAIKVAKRALETAENRQRSESGGDVALLGRDLAPEFAKWCRKRAIGILRPVAGDQYPGAEHPHEPEGQDNSGWRLRGRRQREPQRQ